jgi:thiamine-phosphate pyrophosphorylase
VRERLRGIYVILDGEVMDDLLGVLDGALRAGVRLFQYREKRGPDRELLLALHTRTQVAGALLLVNDAAEVAHFADGLHLGQEDLWRDSLPELRRRLVGKIIGLSAHTPAQAEAATDVDYLGVGPFRATASKATTLAPLGIAGIVAVAKATDLPVCAIGGITAKDLGELRAHRIPMAAAIGAVAKAEDPFRAAQLLHEAWNAAG